MQSGWEKIRHMKYMPLNLTERKMKMQEKREKSESQKSRKFGRKNCWDEFLVKGKYARNQCLSEEQKWYWSPVEAVLLEVSFADRLRVRAQNN